MIFLDTSSIIELLAGTEQGRKISILIECDAVAVSAISVNELLVGETKRKQLILDFLKTCFIMPFDSEASYKSVEIEDKLRSSGKLIGKLDIFIAAICMSNEIPLLTFDHDFKNVDGLKLVSV